MKLYKSSIELVHMYTHSLASYPASLQDGTTRFMHTHSHIIVEMMCWSNH